MSAAPSNTLVYKYWLPIMAAFMTLILYRTGDKAFWTVIPITIIAVYVSAANLRESGHDVYYRRLLKWKPLPHDIVEARCTLLPAIGYVRFRHFLPPFGILLFIVERDHGAFFPFRKIEITRNKLRR